MTNLHIPTLTKKFMPLTAASILFPHYIAKSMLTAFTLHIATSALIFQCKWRSSCPHSGPHHIHTFMWQINTQRIHPSHYNISTHLQTQMEKFISPLWTQSHSHFTSQIDAHHHSHFTSQYQHSSSYTNEEVHAPTMGLTIFTLHITTSILIFQLPIQ